MGKKYLDMEVLQYLLRTAKKLVLAYQRRMGKRFYINFQNLEKIKQEK